MISLRRSLKFSKTQLWVLLLSAKTQIKITENRNIRSSVWEPFNNRWTGCIVVPFFLQISRIEVMIFWVLIWLNIIFLIVRSLKCSCPMSNHLLRFGHKCLNSGRFWRLDDRKFRTLVTILIIILVIIVIALAITINMIIVIITTRTPRSWGQWKGSQLATGSNILPFKVETDIVHFRELEGKGSFTIKMDFMKHAKDQPLLAQLIQLGRSKGCTSL